MQAQRLSRLSLVAALYVVLTYLANILGPGLNLGYGPIQIRISEGLTMLALFDPLMPLALYAGCLMANVIGGLGLPDIIFGPLLTVAAGYATWLTRRIPALPFVPPILFNALGVAGYLYFLLGINFGFAPVSGTGPFALILNLAASHPYWAMVFSIGIGQTISVVFFGLIFMKIWKRSGGIPEGGLGNRV
ncbi:queuosine precursor transporter QueT [bacterium BMS3Abin14]|nr:queuosine precursor transporter QueT [bacterium BMS3Abin14]